MSKTLNTYVNYAFLVLSIACICTVLPSSFTTIKSSDVVLSQEKPEIIASNETYECFQKFVQLLDSAESQVNIAIKMPANSSSVPQEFSDALKKTADRGVKVCIYTANTDYVPPSGIEIRQFPNKQMKYNVNFMTIDENTTFIPTTFFPFSNITFYAYFQNNPLATFQCNQLFEYLWTLPANHKHYNVKYRWTEYHKAGKGFSFVFGPQKQYPLLFTEFTKAITDAFDDSADRKIIFTENLYGNEPTNFEETMSLLQSMSYLTYRTAEDSVRVIINRADALNNRNHVHALQISRNNANDAMRVQGCGKQYVIEGTLIAAKDAVLLYPGGYRDALDQNTLTFALNVEGQTWFPGIEDFATFLNGKGCGSIAQPEFK